MSGDEDQYDRDNYSLIIITLLDTDLEDNSKVSVLCYLNGELDDSIKLKASTTIFIHKQDVLTFEIKDFSPPQTIGIIEITTLQLLSESEKIFQKWLPAAYNQKMHKILFEFEIQKMGTLSSSKVIRNQGQQIEGGEGYQNQRGSQDQRQSQQSNSDKYLPCIQSTQLTNENKGHLEQQFNQSDELMHRQTQSPAKNVAIQKQLPDYQTFLDNDIGTNNSNNKSKINKFQNQDDELRNQTDRKEKQQGFDNFTISPIKVIEEQDLKKVGYKFQKLGQNNQLVMGENNPEAASYKDREEGLFQMSGQLTNSASPAAGPSLGIFTTDHQHIYDVLEEELIKLTKTIQNKNVNSLIDKRRSQYLELKNLLKDISEQFETLKRHPCRSCEKKYIPSIQKGIQKLYSGYKQLMDQIALSQQTQNALQQQSLQKSQPIQDFISSLTASKKSANLVKQSISSNSKSPISQRSQNLQQSQHLQGSQNKQGKNNLQVSGNIATAQLSKTAYGMSPNNSKKIDKLKQEEQKAYDLQMNSNFIREQLESQFKKTNDLETENKQLKLRNFVLEADLKNLLKRIQQEKLTFSTRATFKLQEFRQIFEYFHSLRLERETLLDEIHQLQDELSINQQGDKKKNNAHNSSNSNNNSNNQNTNQKSIRQTMNEYAKHKKDTLTSVQQEEHRIHTELAEARHSHFTSSSQQYQHSHPRLSSSLSPKPKNSTNYYNDNQNQQRYAHNEPYPNSRIDEGSSHIKERQYPNQYEDEENYPNDAYYQGDLIQNFKIPSNLNKNYPFNTSEGDNSGAFNQTSHSKADHGSPPYDTRSKENGPSSTSSARNEIHHLLNQRKNVINELLEKIGEV